MIERFSKFISPILFTYMIIVEMDNSIKAVRYINKFLRVRLYNTLRTCGRSMKPCFVFFRLIVI